MNIKQGRLKCFLMSVLLLGFFKMGYGQRYLSDYDSSFFIKDTVRPVINRFSNIYISGYIQPQYQQASSKGAPSYAGGNFSEYVKDRFMLRRARLRVDYRLASKTSRFPAATFTFQFEATERDVNVRDMFMRVYEPAKANFSLSAGLFARPFGYEVNLSSSFRESPERGRMSQILMPSERDLGAMVTYESQSPKKKKLQIKYDIGLFNGQGKSGPAEFDSYKDLISRLMIKPYSFAKNWTVAMGLSFLDGGWVIPTKYKYSMGANAYGKSFIVDSNLSNIGSEAPRHYYGADIQLVRKYSWGKTELRAEYWRGTQPGNSTSTVNPGVLPSGPVYIRSFDGAFFYLVQNIVNKHWEIVAKYDWYDPNRMVKGGDIGKSGTNLSVGDIRFDTWGAGLTYYFNDNLKIVGYYDFVHNESTLMNGYTNDLRDNVLTVRMQLRF